MIIKWSQFQSLIEVFTFYDLSFSLFMLELIPKQMQFGQSTGSEKKVKNNNFVCDSSLCYNIMYKICRLSVITQLYFMATGFMCLKDRLVTTYT